MAFLSVTRCICQCYSVKLKNDVLSLPICTAVYFTDCTKVKFRHQLFGNRKRKRKADQLCVISKSKIKTLSANGHRYFLIAVGEVSHHNTVIPNQFKREHQLHCSVTWQGYRGKPIGDSIQYIPKGALNLMDPPIFSLLWC